MSRTFKDRKKNKANDKSRSQKVTQEFSQHYVNFKRNGPLYEGERCPDCGGLADLQSGYLVCCECGWVEIATPLTEEEIHFNSQSNQEVIYE